MDEYNILRKKKKKNGFATTAILGIIAAILLGLVLFLFLLGRADKNKNNNVNTIIGGKNDVTDNSNSDNSGNNGELDSSNCLVGSKEFVFNNNLRTIKDAAVSYFTIERLPSKIGQTKTLTLKEMQDKKLVLNVLDSRGNVCDGKSSYVEVTKDKTEYVMKIYLSCSDMEDYILIHLGCYDYCKGNVCEKQIDDEPEFEYEYKKTTSCTMSEWSTWGEWTTKKEATSSTKKEDTKVVTSKKTITDTKDPIKGATTYNCDKYGSDYKLDGKYCIKTTSTKEVIDATPSNYSYVCEDKTYTLNGTKCEKVVTTVDKKDAIVNPTEYYCENGYTLTNNNKCQKTVTVTEQKDATANPITYTCPNGYTKDGSKCYRMVDKTDIKDATVTCARGYTLKDNKCTRTYQEKETVNAKVNYTCASGYTLKDNKCTKTYQEKETINAEMSYHTETVSEPYSCNKQVCTTKTVLNALGQMVPQTSCETKKKTCYKDVEYTYFDGYYCPSGYTRDGSKCYKMVNKVDTKNATVNYTCANGYTKSGTTCYKMVDKVDTINANITCATGYTLGNNNKCTKTYQEKETINATANPITYTCPSGYTKDANNKCNKTYNETLTENAKTKPISYSCLAGYTLDNKTCTKVTTSIEAINAKRVSGGYVCKDGYKLNGTKCEKTITNKETKEATKVTAPTTCPTGYNLKDNKCTKTTTEEVKTTYYRYATRSCTGGSVDTKWSTQNDKSLLDSGYKLTGKKRIVTVSEK